MTDIERIQEAYCAEAGRDYRRAAGQFFTPRWIARGMADWVLDCEPEAVIDPACGFGMLLDACRERGFKGRLIGYELDEELARRGREGYRGEPAIDVRCTDFLATPKEEIPAAVVNPPYNRFQRRELPARMQVELAREAGLLASGYTNQYALFLYLVLIRLRPGGRAAFIVPSEFLATGYGVQVKNFLLANRRLRHLILFDTGERVFPEAATTACVMLFDGKPAPALEVWHLAGVRDAHAFAALCTEKPVREADARIRYEQLDAQANWQGLGQAQADFNRFVPLRVFGDVKRGIATGANEYFVLRPSEAKERGLLEQDLLPCIASASSAPQVIFTDQDWDALRREDQPCHLFDGVAAQSEAAQRYVTYGETRDYHQRYLTKMRKPWYKLESRQPAPLLLAVFGRGGFRVCLNRSQAVNLTAFHGFYPGADFRSLLLPIWLYFQSATARTAFARQQRAYGDGLKKLEPGDWSKLLVPDWRRWSQTELEAATRWAEEAVAKFMKGDVAAVEDLAISLDECVKQRQAEEQPTQTSETQMALV